MLASSFLETSGAVGARSTMAIQAHSMKQFPSHRQDSLTIHYSFVWTRPLGRQRHIVRMQCQNRSEGQVGVREDEVRRFQLPLLLFFVCCRKSPCTNLSRSQSQFNNSTCIQVYYFYSRPKGLPIVHAPRSDSGPEF